MNVFLVSSEALSVGKFLPTKLRNEKDGLGLILQS